MSSEPTTVILPFDLGAASRYDQDIFPLTYHNGPGDNLSKGSLLLSSTLEEMAKIKQLGIDLSNDDKFIFNTRTKYQALSAKRAKLEKNRKTFNPFKAFLNYRAARVFHDAALTLFLETKETSEKMQREQRHMHTVPSTEMHTVASAVPGDATIGGIAISLPGMLDDNATQTIFGATNAIASRACDPFLDDPRIAQLDDEDQEVTLAETDSLLSQLDTSGFDVDENVQVPNTSSETQRTDTTSPSSPQPINLFRIDMRNSIVTTSSNFSGTTMNNPSLRSSGATTSQK